MFHIVGERNEKFKTQIFAKSQKPESSAYGRAQLRGMNNRYSLLSSWGFSHVFFTRKRLVLDVGCGGGKNLQRILNHSKSINAIGIDISPTSVKTSVRKNRRAVKSGRLQVVQGSVEALPFASNLFDLVTAVESVHYWEIEKGLSEVYRTLKKGGQFLIVNETQSSDGLDEYLAEVGFKVYTAKQLENFLKQTGFKKSARTSTKTANGLPSSPKNDNFKFSFLILKKHKRFKTI